MNESFLQRRRRESLSRTELEAWQLARLNELLGQILPANRFYAEKLAHVRRPLRSLEELSDWPFTYKDELVASAAANELSAHHTFPLERYVRFHQTSGTQGRPLVVLDTAEDWCSWLEAWQYVLDAAEVTTADRVVMAFSFGPFIGFWSAFEAAAERGALMIPAGGMSSVSRLELIRAHRVTVLLCTPSYALHLAEVGVERQIDVGRLGVRVIIVAGEPGGSTPAIRARIEEAWGAQVIDHAGATEVGPWGYADSLRRGLHVLETDFLAEFLSIQTGLPAAEGELAELVITTLGRVGAPVIRYRTRDLVRPLWNHTQANRFVLLDSGVLGRVDDMLIIRGVNVFPSAVEQILRSFPEVLEYRLIAEKIAHMDHLTVEIEDRLNQPRRVADELQLRLGLKVEVRTVSLGTLPRFEGKGARFVDQRRRGEPQ